MSKVIVEGVKTGKKQVIDAKVWEKMQKTGAARQLRFVGNEPQSNTKPNYNDMLRLAKDQVKAEQFSDALETYKQLNQLKDTQTTRDAIVELEAKIAAADAE